MKDGERGCRRSKKNFPPWRPFSVKRRRGLVSLVPAGIEDHLVLSFNEGRSFR